MATCREYFVANDIRNFYSVSISGYHIAEPARNPISQLAFTLSNGFTFAGLPRPGMRIDDFAPTWSSLQLRMSPSTRWIGRVARRIWEVAMSALRRERALAEAQVPLADLRGGRCNAQEISFNDIRRRCSAGVDLRNTNSLHTNAYDEAITTPGRESVRRAMAISAEPRMGLAKTEKPEPGQLPHRRA